MSKCLKSAVILAGIVLALTGCKQDEADKSWLELDTTYFPFGLGYEWRYEWRNWGFNYMGEEPEEWDCSGTTTFIVVDSFLNHDTLVLELAGNFKDLDNPVKIWDGKIKVGLLGYSEIVSVIAPEPVSYDHYYYGFEIRYGGDTLLIYSWEGDEYSSTHRGESVTRIKGLGTIGQGEYFSEYGGCYENNYSHRLLYFYNGQDTVYKAD